MGILSLLNDATITHYGQTSSIALNFIGEFIKILMGVGVVGVGIILFSLILKCVVLPFDVMQRVSMRKQNQKMQENKEKLEKLQKQYANDKQKYNEKMMEFYKKNGISMMSSCLPMILSIVIFFIAIGAFNSYAQYASVENYNTMVKSYNQTIESYTADFNEDNLSYFKYSGDTKIPCDFKEAEHITIKSSDESKFIYVDVKFDRANFNEDDKKAIVEYAKEVSLGKKYKENKEYFYRVETQKAASYLRANDAENYEAIYAANNNSDEKACVEYVKTQARKAVEKKYDEEISGEKTQSFLWIKNIWQTDAVYKHPVLSFSDFKSGINKEFDVSGVGKVDFADIGAYAIAYEDGAYEEITANLTAEKEAPNGYFILIALSIGTILLQQIVTMKTQKAQSQFSTVDGQGGSQQKMMLIIMTGMFAIFSFMYSSAFSIYMITSNIVSLGSMLIINKVVDTIMNKKEQEKIKEKYSMKSYKKSK